MDDRSFVQYRGMRVNREWMKEISRAQEQATYMIGGQVYERVAFGEESGLAERPKTPCPGCVAKVGEYHVSGCEYERCPACDNPALECECAYQDD
jgi:hypothetical protein